MTDSLSIVTTVGRGTNMNDPETRARMFIHLLENRPEKLKNKSVKQMRLFEEGVDGVLTEELRQFLRAYGRTVPADTPALPDAEARYLMLGPNHPDPLLVIRSCLMLARARLREGVLHEVQAPLQRAQMLLLGIRHLPQEEQDEWSGLVRRIGVSLKMARGRFPSLPWELHDVHDELAVPCEDWPHLILVLCWLNYRLGDPKESMPIAERLRVLMGGPGEPPFDELVVLYGEIKCLLNQAMDILGSQARAHREAREAAARAFAKP